MGNSEQNPTIFQTEKVQIAKFGHREWVIVLSGLFTMARVDAIKTDFERVMGCEPLIIVEPTISFDIPARPIKMSVGGVISKDIEVRLPDQHAGWIRPTN